MYEQISKRKSKKKREVARTANVRKKKVSHIKTSTLIFIIDIQLIGIPKIPLDGGHHL